VNLRLDINLQQQNSANTINNCSSCCKSTRTQVESQQWP